MGRPSGESAPGTADLACAVGAVPTDFGDEVVRRPVAVGRRHPLPRLGYDGTRFGKPSKGVCDNTHT